MGLTLLPRFGSLDYDHHRRCCAYEGRQKHSCRRTFGAKLTHLVAITEDDQGRAIPALLQALIVLVEVPDLQMPQCRNRWQPQRRKMSA